MQWWCSAQTVAWSWTWQPYPGVWALVIALGAGYAALLRSSVAPLGARGRRERRGRIAVYAAGALALWVALDWPVGALGAGYLASAHMVQFLLLAFVSPPLLLYGVPATAFRRLEKSALLMRSLRIATHPLVALASFNIVLAVTHWPPVVDALMPSQLGSFALDMAWLGAGLVLWWPLVAPVPERRWFAHWLKIGYLILATILNTPAFAYLTFSDLPLYATYELAPPVHGIPARVDQRLAGLLMKMGGGLILWTAITILFFRWYREEGVESEGETPRLAGSKEKPGA